MKANYHLYLGRAGHLAAMSEFLIRGWNVAIPEVDVGDDIFVVQDNDGTLKRVQVKTASSKTGKKGFSGQFNVPIAQLRDFRAGSQVYYIFIVRCPFGWNTPVIISQEYLLDHFNNDKIGSIVKGSLILHFTYSSNKVKCSGIDFSKYCGDFADFPVIKIAALKRKRKKKQKTKSGNT